MGNKACIEERRDMTNSFEHYSLNTQFGAEDELFKAIMTLDKGRVQELKANGASLTENVRKVLESGSGRKQNTSDPAVELYFNFIRELKTLPSAAFAEILTLLRMETDKPLYYSEALWFWGNKRCFEPEIFGAVLKAFEQRQMSKKKTMREIIDKDALGCLPLCENNGWLKNPRTRDELIEYVNESGKTECAAWLLEFKNRTADLAAERAKAEKKMIRELNADPNSVSELKKQWRFRKLGDGTLEITCCKIMRGEITVPGRIGKDTVSAIGCGAFSAYRYFAQRTPSELLDFRVNALKRVVLPETVTCIGIGAFNNCNALEHVDIPNGVTEIGGSAFSDCRSLREITLPKGLKILGNGAFSGTGLRAAVIPGSVEETGVSIFYNCTALRSVMVCKGVRRIGKLAFAFCPELEKVELPASLEEIADHRPTPTSDEIQSAFFHSPKVTAIVPRGSYAEQYCRENNIAFAYKEK